MLSAIIRNHKTVNILSECSTLSVETSFLIPQRVQNITQRNKLMFQGTVQHSLV